MKCKKLACKCHLIFKKIATPSPAHKLRRNICRKLHLTKKYAIKKIENCMRLSAQFPTCNVGPGSPRV